MVSARWRRHGYLATASMLVALAIAPVTASAEGLKEIMRQLGDDYTSLNRAVLLEEYDGIEDAARRIANHPTPSLGERLALLARVGSDSGRFKAFDTELVKAASEIGRAAAEKNMEGILVAQGGLMRACTHCHLSFRKQLIGSN